LIEHIEIVLNGNKVLLRDDDLGVELFLITIAVGTNSSHKC